MKVLEKVERRLGEKLFLKGERCLGPKCAMVRKGYPPGVHGRKRTRRRNASEFGQVLREKQKVRYLYGLDDGALARYSKEAVAMPGIFSSNVVRLLESRLDNVIFRLGLAPSRRVARQLVSHGHIRLNGRTAITPSIQVRKDDVVGIRERSLGLTPFQGLNDRLKKYEPPRWLLLDRDKREGKMLSIPELTEGELHVNLIKIKEFYSR